MHLSPIPSLTLPITARPRPPLEAHSSFATRSSLLARTARQRVVVLCPLLLTTVYSKLSGTPTSARTALYRKAVEDTPGIEELTFTGILVRPGQNLVCRSHRESRKIAEMLSEEGDVN